MHFYPKDTQLSIYRLKFNLRVSSYHGSVCGLFATNTHQFIRVTFTEESAATESQSISTRADVLLDHGERINKA